MKSLSIEAARDALVGAETALADAEQRHRDALQRHVEAAAKFALVDPEELAWESADALCRRLDAVVRKAEVRLEDARAAVAAAQLGVARATVATTLPRCDRHAFFAALQPTIAALAGNIATPAVDLLHADLTDADVRREHAAGSKRHLERTMLEREVRRALREHAGAIAELLAAVAELGEEPPRVGAIQLAEMEVAIAIEAYALSAPTTLDEVTAVRWLAPFAPTRSPFELSMLFSELRQRLGGDVAATLDFFRSVVLYGDPHHAFQAAVDRTSEGRARVERNGTAHLPAQAS